jgi:hypothetical protein
MHISGLDSGELCDLLAMMESALFRLNSFSTCAGTVSAIRRVWKSWSDLFRHQCIITYAIVLGVGTFLLPVATNVPSYMPSWSVSRLSSSFPLSTYRWPGDMVLLSPVIPRQSGPSCSRGRHTRGLSRVGL